MCMWRGVVYLCVLFKLQMADAMHALNLARLVHRGRMVRKWINLRRVSVCHRSCGIKHLCDIGELVNGWTMYIGCVMFVTYCADLSPVVSCH